MIKAEMISMLRHDIVNNPSEIQLSALNGKKTRSITQNVINVNRKILENNPLDDISEEEMNNARRVLDEEILVVKDAMSHGDIAIDVYTKVWEECYGQVH